MALILAFVVWTSLTVKKNENKPNKFAKEKLITPGGNRESVTFDDVAGIDEAKQELEEIVEFLKDPKQELRARNISKNVRCLVCQNQSVQYFLQHS